MTPYYEDGSVTIYHGDALEILPTIGTSTVRGVVTDPPYMIGSVSAGSLSSKAGSWADMMNSALWFSAWYREAARILCHDGAFWSFCNWRSLPVVMRAAMDAQVPITSVLVWDKQWIGPGGSQGLRPSYEMVALLAGEGFAIPDRGTPDIWRHKVGSFKASGHPAEKPVGIVQQILQKSGWGPGDLIVDPFLGSGTTAVAARDLRMKCVGIEGEERYCEIAARRLSQNVLNLGAA